MPEVRLIDANALMEKVCGNCQLNDCVPDATDTVYGCMFSESIDQMPTIEPEVRHGRMIEGRYPNENKCSECGKMFRDDIKFIIQDEGGVFHNPSRCPECGCYWDGGADNE